MNPRKYLKYWRNAPINVKPAGRGGRWGNIGILIDRFGPGVGHLNFLAVSGVGISEFLFVPVTTDHFSGWEIWLYLTSHFCPG